MNKDIKLNNLNATELLNEINKKREELISKKIIKKTNSATILENEQPYRIPVDWLWVRLGDIGEIASSKRVHQAQWREEGIPFIRARDIVKLNSNEEYNPELFIEAELYNDFKEKFGVPKINDILITGVGTIGESYIVKDNNPFYFKDGNIIWFKNYFNLEPKFIKYYLDFPKTKLMIQNMSGGTTVATYTISGASSTPVPFPPLKEQQKIAEILSSVDAAIEKTEQVIAKTEEIKKGLMQQLLTKGIGHTEFKQTEIGEIPIEWDIMNLGKLVKLQGGYAFKSTDYCLGGIQLIRISNLFGKYLNLEKEPVFLPIEYKDKYSQYLLNCGDLIMCMTGTVGKEDYGHTVLIQNSNAEYLLNQRVGKFNLITENIDKDYLYWFLSSRLFLDYIYSLGSGTKQANLSAKQVESAKIALPNLTEQKKIVKILNKVNEKIIYDVEKVNKLKEIKQGLMQQLLTGQTRVKID